MNEAILDNRSRESVARHDETLSQQFNNRLRVIAMQAVTYWFSHDRLDNLLAQYIGSLENCELLYAIDTSGRQISSNIYATSIDLSAYGQDLSRRPCATVMYGVTAGASFMGFIAADFYPVAD